MLMVIADKHNLELKQYDLTYATLYAHCQHATQCLQEEAQGILEGKRYRSQT